MTKFWWRKFEKKSCVELSAQCPALIVGCNLLSSGPLPSRSSKIGLNVRDSRDSVLKLMEYYNYMFRH
jgi:hypothetical protein